MGHHTDHAVVPSSAGGWRCEACDFHCLPLPEALAHVRLHQYQVAPPKPLPERQWSPRR